MEFFIEESCGSCSTCRIIPKLMKERLVKILDGKGVMKDIADLEEWATILPFSRCGLGQTAANPIATSIKNFRELYEAKVQKDVEYDCGFDMDKAVKESCAYVGRVPNAH
jgi:[NiFe] hydrogenase diaphorase moiety large subunit